MKKTVTFLLIAVIFSIRAVAQGWQPLGPNDFDQLSYDGGTYSTIATDTADTIYVAYRDASNSNRLTVKKFDPIQDKWLVVGSAGFTTSTAAHISLLITSQNVPMVAFQDASNSNKLTVKKFDGINWVDVGTPALSLGNSEYVCLKESPGGEFYVAYKDVGLNNKLNVKKYNGTSWVSVGPLGISTAGADYISMVFNNTGQPVVCFKDIANLGKASAIVYNGTSWVNIGSAGFSAASAGYTDMAVSSNNTYYVTYQDQSQGLKATVKKFDGASWVSCGNFPLSGTTSLFNKITMDHDTPYVTCYDNAIGNIIVRKFNDTGWIQITDSLMPYGGTTADYQVPLVTSDGQLHVVFRDGGANGNKVIVRKYNGNSWTILGNKSISRGGTTHMNTAFHPNGNIYIAYLDIYSGNKVSVQKYDGVSWSYLGIPGISQGGAFSPAIAVSNSNVPYVVYKDYLDTAQRICIKKFDGTNWINVGATGIVPSDTTAAIPSITIGTNDTIFVEFQDLAYQSKATVLRFDGTNWTVVGTKGFTPGIAAIPYLKADNSNTLYFCYRDGANGNKVSVKKFDGTNWISVGPAFITTGSTLAYSFILDATGTPCVAYREPSGNKATVIRYNAITDAWDIIGNSSFSAGGVNNTISLLHHNGVYYVLYPDMSLGNKAVVMAFNGTSWINIGTPAFTAGTTGTLSGVNVALGVSNNMLTSVYQSGGVFAKQHAISPLSLNGLYFQALLQNQHKVLLEWRVENTNEVKTFELARCTDGIYFTPLVTINNNGQSLQRYQDDMPKPGNNHYRLKINYKNGGYSYSPVRSVYCSFSENWSVHPVPAQELITITISDVKKLPLSISMYDMQGRLLKKQELSEMTTGISLEGLSPGTYYLRSEDGESRTFIKQ